MLMNTSRAIAEATALNLLLRFFIVVNPNKKPGYEARKCLDVSEELSVAIGVYDHVPLIDA